MESIENINYPAPKQEYKVLVRCFTYNHSKYIADALNGFAMQQTNFPYVCLVMDDASTDGEQEVIKVWMERECDMSKAETIDIPTSIVIVVPHKTNASCTFAFYLLKQNLYRVKEEKMMHVTPWREQCAYEAMCEGDDYWIDPLKLQKQVDIMDAHSDIGLIHTAFNIVGEDGVMLKDEEIPPLYRKLTPHKSVGYIYHKLFNNPSSILTCSVMYRIDNYVTMIDHDLFMQVAKKFKIEYIDATMSCYRILQSGMMRSRGDEVTLLLFKTISTQMFRYYHGDNNINVHYNQSDLRTEVDLYFSKYVTHCIRHKLLFKSQFKSIIGVMLKNPRLFIITPYNILRRLCLSI